MNSSLESRGHDEQTDRVRKDPLCVETLFCTTSGSQYTYITFDLLVPIVVIIGTILIPTVFVPKHTFSFDPGRVALFVAFV